MGTTQQFKFTVELVVLSMFHLACKPGRIELVRSVNSSFKGSIFDLNWPEFLEFLGPENSRIFDLDFSIRPCNFWGPNGHPSSVRNKVGDPPEFRGSRKIRGRKASDFRCFREKCSKTSYVFFVKGEGQVIFTKTTRAPAFFVSRISKKTPKRNWPNACYTCPGFSW